MRSYIRDLIKAVSGLHQRISYLEEQKQSSAYSLQQIATRIDILEQEVRDLRIDKWAQQESKEFLDYKLVIKNPPGWMGSCYESEINPLKEQGYFLKCTYEYDPRIELWVKKHE